MNINMALTRYKFSELLHVKDIAASMKVSFSMTRLVLTGKNIKKTLQFTKDTIPELIKGKCRTCKFLHYKGLCDGGAACVAYGWCNDYNSPDPQCWYNPEAP